MLGKKCRSSFIGCFSIRFMIIIIESICVIVYNVNRNSGNRHVFERGDGGGDGEGDKVNRKILVE